MSDTSSAPPSQHIEEGEPAVASAPPAGDPPAQLRAAETQLGTTIRALEPAVEQGLQAYVGTFAPQINAAHITMAGSGLGGALIQVLLWAASLAHVPMTDSVASSLTVIGAAAVGWLIHRSLTGTAK